MARRYILDSVLEAINDSPTFVTSKDIKRAVNRNVRLKGWNRNIGTVQIGQAARVLVGERKVIAKRRPGKDRIYEYRGIGAIRATI